VIYFKIRRDLDYIKSVKANHNSYKEEEEEECQFQFVSGIKERTI
jgi:hypothetical protein